MNRRDFLKGILLAAAAPAIVRASSLMKIAAPQPKFEFVEYGYFFYVDNDQTLQYSGLDDFDTGTWTPRFEGIIDRPIAAPGFYTRIGNQVVVHYEKPKSGVLRVSSLPFYPASTEPFCSRISLLPSK